MKEESEKTMILLVTIFIFVGLYISPIFNKGGKHEDIYSLIILLVIIFSVSFIQTLKLQKWSNDKNKTDYRYVYLLFIVFSIGVFLFIIYNLLNYTQNFNFIDSIIMKISYFGKR